MWLWLRVLWLKLQVTQRLLMRNLFKLVEKDITLQQMMVQAWNLTHCCFCCILHRGLQNVDSVISCRSGICCSCLQRINALLQFDDSGLSFCKLLRQAVKIKRCACKPLAFSTCDALCDELF